MLKKIWNWVCGIKKEIRSYFIGRRIERNYRLFRIADYERLEDEYSEVLSRLSFGAISEPNMSVYDLVVRIENKQAEFCFAIVKDDLTSLINNGGTIEDIKDYIERL